MILKMFASVAIGSVVGLSAMADTSNSADVSEVLAWSVAASGSCESRSALQSDIRDEVVNLNASANDLVAALTILADADNVCGGVSSYAAEMLALSQNDMATFEARLLASTEANAPVFEPEQPKGAGPANSIILTSTVEAPPQSSSFPPSSDYQGQD